MTNHLAANPQQDIHRKILNLLSYFGEGTQYINNVTTWNVTEIREQIAEAFNIEPESIESLYIVCQKRTFNDPEPSFDIGVKFLNQEGIKILGESSLTNDELYTLLKALEVGVSANKLGRQKEHLTSLVDRPSLTHPASPLHSVGNLDEMKSQIDLLFKKINQRAKTLLNSSFDEDNYFATLPIIYPNTSNAQSPRYQLWIQVTANSRITYGLWDPVSGAIYTTSEINYPPENASTVTYQLALSELEYLSELLNSNNPQAPHSPTR